MKKIVKILLFVFLFLFSLNNTCFGQTYIPEDKELILEEIEGRYDHELSKISSNYRSKIKKEYKKRKKYIKEILTDSLFLFDKKYYTFLDSVLERIEKGNPTLNLKKHRFFFSRDATPNAACFGNGVFMLNLGLFNFLKSEDELAFIICHEIAHHELNHVNSGIKKRIQTFNSKEIKEKIKNARAKTYGRTSAGLNLLKEISYGMFKNSRKEEIEADSLGVLLFKNTSYNIEASALALKRLKRVDNKGVFKEDIKLDSLLDFKNYSFKEYWLDEDETLFDIKERVDDYEWDEDSLKTHPDIDERIEVIKKYNLSKNNKTTPFKDIQVFAKEQQIESLLDIGSVDISLYLLLKDLQTKKSINDFIIIKIAETFKKVYELKIGHELGRKIPQTSPFTKERNLNILRQFLHNLEIKEVRKIGYNFCEKYKETRLKENKEFKLIREYFKELNK